MPQAQVMSPSVQARSDRSRKHGFSGRGSCPPCVFEWHPLNLDRGDIGSDYVHPLNLDWNSGNSWANCGNIHWELFWGRDFLFRGWCRVGSRDDLWCTWKCVL